MRVKDLYNLVTTLINDIPKFSNAEWFTKIKELADDFIQIHYNERCVNDLFVRCDNDDTINLIRKIIELCIKTNEYTFSKLYETTILEYNPLWNVDGTETTVRDYTSSNKNNQTINTTDKTVINTTDNVTVETTDSTNINTTDNTSINTTNNRTINMINDNDTMLSKTTYDSDVLHLTDETINIEKQNGTDNTTINTTDNKTINTTDNKTVNTTDNKTLNTTDNLTRSGTVADDRNVIDKETTILTRQGNIGVTKSTDLIDSQRVTVEFNYIKEVCHKLINEFTILID